MAPEQQNQVRDLYAGAAICGFALLALWQANALRSIEANEPLGPASLPLVLSLSLFVLGGIVALRGMRAYRGSPVAQEVPAAAENPDLPRLAAASATFAVYVLSMLYVNFYLATGVLVLALLWIGGSRSWTLNISVAIAVNLFCHIVFVSLLGLPIANI